MTYHVGFEFYTAVTMAMLLVWLVTLCKFVGKTDVSEKNLSLHGVKTLKSNLPYDVQNFTTNLRENRL
jgi:hypothetical protein